MNRDNVYTGERAILRAAKIFDAGLKQIQNESMVLRMHDNVPALTTDTITFVSGASKQVSLTGLTVDRLGDNQKSARVRGTLNVVGDVVYLDGNNAEGCALTDFSIPVDALMNIPDQSIVPYRFDVFLSAVFLDGVQSGVNVFTAKCCMTYIIKVVVDVDIVVPTYGYYRVPTLQDYTNDACATFFELPLFPG